MIGGTVYAVGSIRGFKAAQAYSIGTGAYHQRRGIKRDPPHCFYGVNPRMWGVWQEVQRSGEPWLYIDNGYFKGKDGERYYSISGNAPRYTGPINPTAYGIDRWNALGREIEPWRTGGYYVLLCMQSPFWYERHGIQWKQWEENTAHRIEKASGIPVQVRRKPSSDYGNEGRPPPILLGNDFDGAAAVVSHSSNTATDAIIAGIPAFTLAPFPSRLLGFTSLDQLADPPKPENRLEWAQTLAGQQWSLQEMARGEFIDRIEI